MPCHETRTISVEFKVGNIDLLKKAIEKAGYHISGEYAGVLTIKDQYGNKTNIDLRNQTITSANNENQVTTLANSLKRSYSEVVISEVAAKQKWIAKKLSDRKFQLVKY
ncbi:MAG: hypothetical protein ABIC57_01400 [bacterium]